MRGLRSTRLAFSLVLCAVAMTSSCSVGNNDDTIDLRRACGGVLTAADIEHMGKINDGKTSYRDASQEGETPVEEFGVGGVAHALRKQNDPRQKTLLCKIQTTEKETVGNFSIAYSWSTKVDELKPIRERYSTSVYYSSSLGEDVEMRDSLLANSFESHFIFFKCELSGDVGVHQKYRIVEGELRDRFVRTDWDVRRSILANSTRFLVSHLDCENEVSVPDIRNEVIVPREGEGPPRIRKPFELLSDSSDWRPAGGV